MKTIPDSKFALDELHQEIDFFDRKIAYCQTFEKFDSQDERASALRKLATKRGSLVKNALAMGGTWGQVRSQASSSLVYAGGST